MSSPFDPPSPAPERADFDALAELFLGPEPPDELPLSPPQDPLRLRTDGAPQPAATSAAGIGGLLLGHLPVRSTPWAAQFAAARSITTGQPVALARLGVGRLTIDLFGTPATQAPPPLDASTAMQRAAASGATWLVALDELEEATLLTSPHVGALTLLSGANDAALVAGYRMLKALSTGMDDGRPVGVAIMGAEGIEAERAADKLQRTTELFLTQPLEVLPPMARLQPTDGQPLFRGSYGLGAEALLASIDAAGSATELQPEQLTPPAATFEEPKTVGHQTPRPEHLLAAYVGGLTAMPVRCPLHDDIELATDADGRLHLLASADGAEAVRKLTEVRAWAGAHAALLSHVHDRLQPGEPLMHVFTARPADVRGLLDAEVRVHLLTTAAGRVRDGMFCTGLN